MDCYPHSDEKQRTISAIINLLNQLEADFTELDRILATHDRVFAFIVQDAAVVIDRFFYRCQIIEEKIKLGQRKGYLSKEQVADLNDQLRRGIARLVDTSKQSEVLTQILREKFGADVVD